MNTGVHFHEIKLAVFVHQKLDRTRAFVADGLRTFDGRLTHFFAQFGRNDGRGGFFYQLLMAALNRAIALRQVAHLAVLVAHNLDFDVAGFFHKFFEIQTVVAKSRRRLHAGIVPGFFKFRFFVYDAHTAPTTASGGFDDNGVPDAHGQSFAFLKGFEQALRAWNNGYARRPHGGFGGGFVAHAVDLVGGSPDKFDAVFGAYPRKFGVFGQKPVARVNGIGVGDFGCRDDIWNTQVRLPAGRWANTHGFVGKTHVEAVAVGG